MPAGRPLQADPRKLYGLAQHFYWEFQSIVEPPFRLYVDRKKEEQLLHEVEKFAALSPEDLAEFEQDVGKQIQRGWLPENRREDRIRELKEEIEFSRRFAGENAARELSEKVIKIRREPEIIDDLLRATSPDQIREICADAITSIEEKSISGETQETLRPNWPISGASLLPSSLAQYASQFVAAKNDPRFPKSGRPTSRKKQLWFLSRALAGAACGITTRTAINLIGSVRPDESADPTKLSKHTRHSNRAKNKTKS